MKNSVQLPLFVHITRVPQGSELRNKCLEGFNVREGRTFRHLPDNKGDKDQKPTEVELIAMILHFTTV
jgi:hypothetical protein